MDDETEGDVSSTNDIKGSLISNGPYPPITNNRILSKAQILLVLKSYELLLTLYVAYQSVYFIFSFHQVEF